MFLLLFVLFPSLSYADCNEDYCPVNSHALTVDFVGSIDEQGACWFVKSYGSLYVCDINMNYLCECDEDYSCKGCECWLDEEIVFSPELFFEEVCVPSTPRPSASPSHHPSRVPTISSHPTTNPSSKPTLRPTTTRTEQPTASAKTSSSSSKMNIHLFIKITALSFIISATLTAFCYFLIYKRRRRRRMISDDDNLNDLLLTDDGK